MTIQATDDVAGDASATGGLMARAAATLLPTYARQPVAFVAGEGCWLTDAEGRRHLDALCGLAVTSLGHAHPDVTAAISSQAARLLHTSNLTYTVPQIEVAERLATTLGWPDARTFLANSGAEAVEGALKLARRHGLAQADGKVGVVALSGGFHGRTLAALAVTGSPAKHAPFEPLGAWVTHVGPDDPAALEVAVGADTCAVLLEVVQGEAGVVPISEELLRVARRACDRVGALLVIDEVQTGIGRLGAWYGWQTTAVEPDVVTLAKALGNGLPIGAVVARGAAATAFGPGDHGSTFGGGPLPCAAARTVLDVIARDGLVAHAQRMGAALRARLEDLTRRHPVASGVRGRGLLQALELDAPVAAPVTSAALARGLVVNAVAPAAVRLSPPLIITEPELDQLHDRLDAALADSAGAR